MAKELIKGNVAMAEAAIRAGLEAYFGYPITPQTEVLEHLARRMPELGRAFVQAESEVAAINMVYGAACTGVRVMTSSSSPGVSLMQEGLSYIAGTEVPAVIINVMRGGPGLGNIAPAQSDYYQSVHGGGHGDYHPIVLAPASVQESIDLTVLSFELAEKYRNLAFVLSDGSVGQMMEPAELPPMQPIVKKNYDWAIGGKGTREKRILTSININPHDEEIANLRMLQTWFEIKKNEVRYKEYYLDDAEFLVIGFGTSGRVALSAVRKCREKGIKVGLLRPITLRPFPDEVIIELAERVHGILVVEMNQGQMLDDVMIAVGKKVPIEFYGRPGGVIPFPEDVESEIERMVSAKLEIVNNPRVAWLDRMLHR
jgi:2-oxoglutarate ferredoxin oxidoreductase subunit alpha